MLSGPLNGVTVHKRLAQDRRAHVEDVAQEFFEKVLGQKMSDEPVRVVEGRAMTK